MDSLGAFQSFGADSQNANAASLPQQMAQQQARIVPLNARITQEAVASVLEDESCAEELQALLPFNSREELSATVSSPVFQQTLRSFTAALVSGESYNAIIANLGVRLC